MLSVRPCAYHNFIFHDANIHNILKQQWEGVRKYEILEQKNENVPRVSKNWQHFTFICDKTIVSKIRAIADREGFYIRELIEHILANAITSYESKHGEPLPRNKSINDIL